MEQLLVGLLFWISQHSDFEYQQPMSLPAIEQVTQLELATIYIDKNQEAQGYVTKDNQADVYKNMAVGLEAVYDSKNNTIYVGKKIILDSDYGRSVVVHELVHFLQKTHNHHEKVDCKSALEKDAYLIQEEYMKQHQIEPSFNRMTVLMRSMCPDTY